MFQKPVAADQVRPLTRPTLKTPRAAAVAGFVFSILMIAILWLLRQSVRKRAAKRIWRAVT